MFSHGNYFSFAIILTRERTLNYALSRFMSMSKCVELNFTISIKYGKRGHNCVYCVISLFDCTMFRELNCDQHDNGRLNG